MSSKQKSQQAKQNQPSQPATASNYKPDPKEEHLVHALIEQEVWDKGKKLSKPTLQKFTPVAFLNFKKNAGILGYTVTILHEPGPSNQGSAGDQGSDEGNQNDQGADENDNKE